MFTTWQYFQTYFREVFSNSGAKLYQFVELEDIPSLNMYGFEIHDVIR